MTLFSIGVFAQNFEVNLNIKGIESSTTYITAFGKEDKNLEILNDSRFPIKEGQCIIKGTVDEPAVLRISFSGNKKLLKMVGGGYIPVKSASLWVIVYPGAKINAAGDITGKDYVNVYPKGDAENNLFAELNEQMMPLLNEGANLTLKQALDTIMSAEASKKLEGEMERNDAQTASVREKFISENPSCIASLWLMEDMLIRSQIEPSFLESLMNRVDKKYFNNYFYISVKNRLDGAKSAAVGAICPSIKGNDQFGKDLNIMNFRGKYVIIDFWGTWCGACLAGMPAMKAFRDAHSDKVQILGVANDKNVEAWKKCINAKGMNWPNIIQGTGENDFVSKFNVQGFPTKILVGPDGKILYRASGESDEFYKTIEDIISKK